MTRFRCRSCDVTGDEIRITDREQIHHLKVLRLVPGDEAGIFDELGNEFECRITGITADKLVFSILKKRSGRRDEHPLIAIAVALPKKSKIDDSIDKLTQLGADRIIPLITERVIVRADARDLETRYKRWEKIAEAATLQSQRNRIPQVDQPVRFDRLIQQSAEFDLKLIPTLEGDRRELRDVLKALVPEKILVLIGPEGDFSPAETAAACKAGFIPVSFGPNVLRVETAALYIASILSYEFRK
jgi:16S rRNA (uracil1498-N3)-methyltransferase